MAIETLPVADFGLPIGIELANFAQLCSANTILAKEGSTPCQIGNRQSEIANDY
jgi:hypothetical protein